MLSITYIHTEHFGDSAWGCLGKRLWKGRGTVDRLEEARLILEAIKSDRFSLRGHAQRRGDERMLSRQSVMNIAASVIGWKYQEEKFSHCFIGFLDGGQSQRDGGQSYAESGGFCAVLDEKVGVLTIFRRHLTRKERELAQREYLYED
jgi:hypothetical protein